HRAVHNSLAADKAAGAFSPRLATELTKVIDNVLEEAGEVYNIYKHVGTGKKPNKNGVLRTMQSILDPDKMDSMLVRNTTWYGRGPEWHTYRNGLGYAEKLAMTRAKWFRDINKNFTFDEQ